LPRAGRRAGCPDGGDRTTGGRAALFWNDWRQEDELAIAIDEAYARCAPELRQTSIVTGNADDARVDVSADALLADGAFVDPERRDGEWSRRYTTAHWLDQLPTHSDHRTLAPDRLAALLDAVGTVIEAHGGAITVHYRTRLVAATRRA
jgi:hypothetical protein